jgi:F-type H+/Na+-transporting ATPase subunit alpha
MVKAWERDFHIFLRANHPGVLDGIRETKDLSKETEEALKGAIERYAELFADPHSPVGTENYADSAILHETDADRRMSEEQLRMASRPEANAAAARQSY